MSILFSSQEFFHRSFAAMDMKKISCAVLIAAASMTAVLASTDTLSPAPGPSSGSIETLPAAGTLVGASVLSFLAFYLQ